MILLRDLKEADRNQLFLWRNLPEIRQWMYTHHVITKEEHDSWFSAVLDDSTRRYWVIVHGEDPVGVVNLSGIGLSRDAVHLGIYVGEKTARGSGVARRAIHAAMKVAFTELAVPSVIAEVFADNIDAVRLYEAVGMRPVGGAEQEIHGRTVRSFELTSDLFFGRTHTSDSDAEA